MQGFGNRRWLVWSSLAFVLAVAGCSTAKRGPAPVEDRGTMSQAPAAAAGPVIGPNGLPITDANGKPLPGVENLGKPGYYAVRPGDTIRRIASETSQNWRDLARWNNLDNPDLIEVGQVLRVIPPAAGVPVAAVPPTSMPPAAAAGASAATGTTAPAAAASAPAVKPTPPVTTSSVAPAAAASGDEDVGWIWPAHGSLIAGFDEVKNKGLDIGGKAGDAVLAAADGRVVYAGAGLRGYGNLIILKHNNTYLTAYAHNQTLLVKEDQSVQKGQKIAEMGSSDADRVKLHFEIRRQGKPVDPSRYLPAR
ncbi:Murein hydrolase activator NlpD [Xylophilus ampelinus]|nr:peptidoglycan DD-metalloendopeptidase family protein [Variovorax sp.]VTY31978.1 Murein hydrolase activator NlpD [Xylophilus ampelinus]